MSTQKSILVSLLIFTLINIIQAFFQPLLLDEAYYYYYSQNLSLGYFDHPPLVAFLIKIGSFLGRNEIGVRLGSVLLSSLTFWLLLKILNPAGEQIDLKAMILVFSFPFVNALYLAIPDSGLIFFTVFFYWVLERYLMEDNYRNGLLLGIISAGLVYAKYHGALSVLFVIIANLNLLKRKSLWSGFGMFLLLISPHIYWLMDHNWVTIKFQLFGRGSGGFFFRNIQDYLLSFGFVTSGLLFIALLLPVNFKQLFSGLNKAGHLFPKTLLVSVAGFFIFFLIFSFRGPIETNWLFSAAVPLLILVGRSNILKSKLAVSLATVSAVFIMIFRVMLMTSTIPNVGYLHLFSGYEQWAKDIKYEADSAAVYFENSYQMAAMYTFQTGEKSFSLNTLGNRGNQYDFECFESIDSTTSIMLLSERMYWEHPVDSLDHEKGKYKMERYKGLVFLNGVQFNLIRVNKENEHFYHLDFSIDNKCAVPLIQYANSGRLKVFLELFKAAESPTRIELIPAEYLISDLEFKINILLTDDIESVIVGLNVDDGPISNNSEKITLP